MKQLMCIAAGFGVIIALGVGMNRAKTSPGSPVNTATASAPVPSLPAPQRMESAKTGLALSTPAAEAASRPKRSQAPVAAAVETQARRDFRQAIETLLSPQSTFEEKQAMWKQLKSAGQQDDAIHTLEERVAGNPGSVEDTVALGEAYLKKGAQSEDIRQTATLAMKADQVFDTALSLDPSNWEAQFDKVSAMAHWPLELNQGQKVLDQFQALIGEQESQPAQPQFALSYVRLGEFYQKTGDATDAVQVWQHGAALFPNNADLLNKLSPAP